MKKILCLTALLLLATHSYAEKTKGNDWENTTISEETIAKIQAAKLEYKKCASDEMQKTVYRTQESRAATETIIKQCESVLSKMREVYIGEKVPEVVADRHLKQLRLQTTRDVLQNMMYAEAARSTGSSK
jgi:phage terminase large subunit GpA-like protein